MKRVPLLETAGGRIQCPRCQALNREAEQCAKPAIKGKRVCNFHGGRSTGPKTVQGMTEIKLVATKHGKYSKEGRQTTAAQLARFRQLEDALFTLGVITEGQRTRGRKPRDYEPLITIADVKTWAEGIAEE